MAACVICHCVIMSLCHQRPDTTGTSALQVPQLNLDPVLCDPSGVTRVLPRARHPGALAHRHFTERTLEAASMEAGHHTVSMRQTPPAMCPLRTTAVMGRMRLRAGESFSHLLLWRFTFTETCVREGAEVGRDECVKTSQQTTHQEGGRSQASTPKPCGKA